MDKIWYSIEDNFNHIFDEKGNVTLCFRKIKWNDKKDSAAKYDLRKWYTDKDGDETVGKGFAFLTEEGPNQLSHILVQTGFGKTKELLDILSKRDDFRSSLNKILGDEDEYYDPSIKEDVLYYDPKELVL